MKIIHWLLIWPCLWIGGLYKEENWWSEQSSIHWIKSRKWL